MEKIIFPFVNGKFPIEVGQEVAMTNVNRKTQVYSPKIEKIGKKLIHLDNGFQFYIENGQEKSNYCHNWLYSSMDGYVEYRYKEGLITDIQQQLSWTSTATLRKGTVEELEQIKAKILEMKAR